ncbi:TetR/AcrR family transcriptional regulator [Variovorax arabinosiphilus]|uniref:TetR/AcrR family transcriptional regulator n=1 Tax=Variovorax arabinosiphilus TaxID=3053498 RepID=UPI0025758993|nr:MULTISPECIES: TetR/AcrR family transcriptional regulator [unclassified Variovorax]MDM0118390.1 TetR/AcrR family transcriptional regulator [Variovorax sp. J2L1-78]MDM0128815.1 TetR/AcrR family transcriptional regulator [Variovorax sp. J2L1-63]MDM0233399.1 TetR/AcrR family transcriptional regulator [Variovorax sp. J2R1-6]
MPSPLSTKRKAPQPVASAASYHHGDLRNALLREGRRLLEERGAGELSLRECARRVGVSEAAPSRHFEGKEGLLAGIASDGFRELAAQRMAIAAMELSTLEKTREMLLSYVRYAQANKGLFNLMVGPRILETQRHAELVSEGSRSFNLFSEAVVQLAREHGWPSEQLELVAHSAWAMEHGLATLILGDRAPRADRQVDLQQMIDFSIAMLLSAIVAGPKAFAASARPGGSKARSRAAHRPS